VADTVLRHPAVTPRALTPRSAFVAPAGTEAGIGTIEDRLSRLVAETAGVARQESRRAQSFFEAAYTDRVTRLPNRRALEERLEDPDVPRGAVMMIDLDGFKAVNDAHGHAAGDRILVAVADALRASLRMVDFAARYGGDEFTVVLADATVDSARPVAERLRTLVERELADFGVTLSIGIGHTPAGADTALYAAKHSGRNRVMAGPQPARAAMTASSSSTTSPVSLRVASES
jgi:diguanylate cyclase (GGDEF)-like protein